MKTACVAVAVLAACGHSEPSGPFVPERADDPFTTAAPLRLTYDAGIDGFPSFSLDGSLLLFSFQPRDRNDNDRCIGIMPALGGTREEHCDNSGVGAFRTDALEYPAINSRGDLLYARYASAIGDLIPNTNQISLQLASRDAPLTARNILQLPTTIEGIGLTRIGTIRWADDATFYFVAEEMTLVRNPISKGFRDTVITGNGLLRGRVTTAGVIFEAVSGILDASGFDFSAGRDSIFFTRQRDNRLYVVAIAGSAATVVYSTPQSLTAPRELRDPARMGDRVAAVSQDVEISEPPLYPAGLTPGARLELIRTSDGTSTTIQQTSSQVPSFGRLAAQPGACRLVVEYRHRQSVSFTTDLYSICPQSGATCNCN